MGTAVAGAGICPALHRRSICDRIGEEPNPADRASLGGRLYRPSCNQESASAVAASRKSQRTSEADRFALRNFGTADCACDLDCHAKCIFIPAANRTSVM